MEKQEQYERVFGYLDENGDGKISAAELQSCIGKIGGEGLSSEEAEMVAELMDSDGDGLLSMEDVVRVVEGADEEERVNDLKMAFNKYAGRDTDDLTRVITPKSLKRMLSRLGESRSIHDCESMIAKFDLDSNGVLDFHEFQDMMR